MSTPLPLNILQRAALCSFPLLLLLTACITGEQTSEEEHFKQAEQQITLEQKGSTRGSIDLDNKKEELGAVLSNIRNMVGVPYAQSQQACQVIALGQKPCGGPERYMVYSEEVVQDKKQLLQLVQTYNQLSAFINKQEQLVSDCQVIPEPAVVLQNGQCIPQRRDIM